MTAHGGAIDSILHGFWSRVSKNKGVIFVCSLTDCVDYCTKYSICSLMWRGMDATPTLLGAKRNQVLFMRLKQSILFLKLCNFFPTRFQLSLRVAAMCSKALYRVKTMDSLDYRDSVCVFLQYLTVPLPLVTRPHLSLFIKIKL